jgi:glycine dehydrogenase subunit 2
MHEVVFSDAIQKKNGVNTMDIAKRLIDYGFHPYTTAFPLIVPGALMIEPTESESKEECDLFIDAMRAIADEAATDPELVKMAPHTTRVTRLDEVTAARKPILRWKAAHDAAAPASTKEEARPKKIATHVVPTAD